MIATTLKNDVDSKAGRGRARRAQQGASLVEVLVVLAIIVGGLLLALQVFPVGFGQIKASGNRTLATQLAEQMMGQVNGDDANLPQGVVFKYFNSNGALVSVSEVDPDDLSPCRYNDSNPCINDPSFTVQAYKDYTNFEQAYVSDVNKFRYIEGESVKVPLPTPGGFGTGSVYACKFGPMLMNEVVGIPANAPTTDAERTAYGAFLRVTGAPLTGIVVQAYPNQDGTQGNVAGQLRSPQTYLIDYGSDTGGNGDEPVRVMFAARAPRIPARQTPSRVFKVTVTYDSGDENLITRSFDVNVPDNFNPVWQTLSTTETISDAVAGSDRVQREFQRVPRPVGGNPAWDTDDPYQYALISSNIRTNAGADTRAVFANMGILSFNPAGGTYAETVATGTTRPFTAYIDYATLDWHILRDDREVPSALPDPNNLVPIRTTLGNIRSYGETNVGVRYLGMYGVGTDIDPQDIQIFNLDAPSGIPLVAGDYNNGGTPAPAATADGADYYIQRTGRGGVFGTGTIYINTTRLRPGAHLRVLYKARGDWAVAIQKSFARYNAVADPTDQTGFARAPTVGGYFQYGRVGSGNAAEIRMPLADLNKAFVLTLQYTLPDGRVRRLSPVQMVANVRGRDLTVDEKAYDQNYSVITIANYLTAGQRDEFNQATSWRVVGPISGVSLKTRVIWHDNDNVQNRWRVQDMDTFLTPDTL